MNKFLILLALFLIIGCVSTNDSIIIASVSSSTSNPFSLVTIYALNTNVNADSSYVRFYDNNGFDVNVSVLEIINESITVSVPPYVNNNKFAAGLVSVELIQEVNDSITRSNILNLSINDLPISKANTGWVTLDYLRGIFNASMQLSTLVNGSIYDTKDVGIELLKNVLITGLLYSEINNVIVNNGSYYLGSINNEAINVTPEVLNNTDRLILALLNAQAKIELKEPGVVKFALENTPGCLALEAKSLSDVVESGSPVAYYTGYYNAPITSINCKTAEAFTDGFKVLMGSSGVALGLMSLVGAPAALASAGLLYINVEMGGGLVLLGGALGKETIGARELVLEGYERLKDAGSILKENTLSSIELDSFLSNELPEPFDDLLDVWTSLSDLRELITKNETVSKFVKLIVYREGDVYGSFNVDKAGLTSWGACTHECSMLFKKGETITLKSINNDLIFTGWTGDCTGTGNCVLEMTSTKNVHANFKEDLVNLTINRLGDAYGTVTTNPGGLSDFGDCTSTCVTTYKRGSKITLTGNDYEMVKFTSWGGDCSGEGVCKLVMDSDKTVSVNYNSELVSLTINRPGTYYGTFNIDASVFDSDFDSCTTSCTATFAKDTTVTLTPVETTGVTFTGWSGACTGAGNCVIVMDSNKTVTELFSTTTTQVTEPVQTSGDLSVSMTETYSTSVKASGSWGTECNYVLTTSGTASGPVGAKIHVYGAGGEAEYFSFNGWTKHIYAASAQRLSGEPESTTWTSSYSFSCIIGDEPIEVYATTSFNGPTGIYYSESTTKKYFDCSC